MKKCIGLLALMSVFLFVACNAVDSPFDPLNNDSAFVGLPSGIFLASKRVDFLSENEQAAIDEMNYARTRPKDYAYNILKPFLDNKCYTEEERETYVQTAFDRMVAMKPLAPLKPALGLTLAARDFIADPGRDVHKSTSPDFEGFVGRAKLYGTTASNEIAWETYFGGSGTGKCFSAETVVSGWIIDRGNAPGYGHRRAILSAGNRYIGLAFGYGSPTSTVGKYQNASATYATLASASYKDLSAGDYKGGMASPATDALTLTSITEVVTWPVLRYEDGKFFQYDAAGVKGAEETKTLGVRTIHVR